MPIVTRVGKGSELTHAEMDNNFTELDSRIGQAQLVEGEVNSGSAKILMFQNTANSMSVVGAPATIGFLKISGFAVGKNDLFGELIYVHKQVSQSVVAVVISSSNQVSFNWGELGNTTEMESDFLFDLEDIGASTVNVHMIMEFFPTALGEEVGATPEYEIVQGY